MSWTAPMTAVANTAFTAAQFNTHVRDNLLMTAPAKATTAGGYFAATGTNAIAQRVTGKALVTTTQTTTSGSYTNLATTGPTLTLTTGVKAIALWSAEVQNNAIASSYMSVAVSGATTVAATDQNSLRFRDPVGATMVCRAAAHDIFDLTAGSNTFKCVYRVSAGTGTWADRRLTVIPL